MNVQFNVGDIVTGKQSATEWYSVTIRGAILEVIEVRGCIICVKVIGCDRDVASDSIKLAHEGRDPSRQIEIIEKDARIGYSYSVLSERFELRPQVAIQDASELHDFLNLV